MRDWQECMDQKGAYDPMRHNMTDHLYTFPTGAYMEFFSVDDSKKVRGPGRDILFVNEANLLDFDTARQLFLRTTKHIILDYNPADEFHWIYDEVLTRDDCCFIQSSYLDNPFLSKEQRQEIERLRDGDPNYWKVFGQGERGSSEATVYVKWDTYDRVDGGDTYFGLDFGYNNPCALVKETLKDEHRYWEEMLYESHLTTPDIIERVKPIVGNLPVYCDSAEPGKIEELSLAGINVYPADKVVRDGIDEVLRKPLHIQKQSVNALKEIKSYKWKQDKSGRILKDEPLKRNDHIMDAGRYAAFTHKNYSSGPFVQPRSTQ